MHSTVLVFYKYLGRILFPATGYLELVWKKFASTNGKQFENFPVEFENVRFERATIMPKEGQLV